MVLCVDSEFAGLISPLSADEQRLLEQSIKVAGCLSPLIVWHQTQATLHRRGLGVCKDALCANSGKQVPADQWRHADGVYECPLCGYGIAPLDEDVLLDGHNRKDICDRLDVPFKTVAVDLPDREAAKDWIIKHQLGRRNLSRAQWEYFLGLRYNREKQQGERTDLTLGQNDTKLRTADKLAAEYGVSPATVKRAGKTAEILDAHPAKRKAVIQDTTVSIGDAKREIKRAEVIQHLESVETKEAKEISGTYDVLVIDPPWPMQRMELDARPNAVAMPYPVMSVEKLEEMQLPCADNCHVWLWTTHKFLPTAFHLLTKWGLKYVCTFVWHKDNSYQPIGLPKYNCEFALYARRGSPVFIDTKAFWACFNAPSTAHSVKPDAFYDVVRRTTAGRRLDMFNRRTISGFDGWGKEAPNERL